MNTVLKIAAIIISLSTTMILFPQAAKQNSVFKVSSQVHWAERYIEITVQLNLKLAGLRMPDARLQASRRIESELPSLLLPEILTLQIDSQMTLADYSRKGDIAMSGLINLIGSLVSSPKTGALTEQFSNDLSTFTAQYKLMLEDIAALFPPGRDFASPQPALDSIPTRNYTGILIFANTALPLRGENKTALPKPVVFPTLYNNKMQALLNRSTVDQTIIGTWGIAGYATMRLYEFGKSGASSRQQADIISNRVGDFPLRIWPKGLIGSVSSDLILSEQDSLRILSATANIDLLKQGKVLIILPEESLPYSSK